MRGNVKRKTVALLAAASALCLGGALALGANGLQAHADEGAPSYHAFVNVGANTDASLIDEALGLTAKGGTATVAGTVTGGGTLFTSFATDATYSFDLTAGAYQVAVAVIAEETTAVTVGGEAVAIPAGTAGKYVVAKTVTLNADGAVAVAVTGKLCGVLITEENGKVLMTADYTSGQVVSYGALLADELDNATGYYSDGTTEELAIHYENITAGGGVNVNFTTVNVSGQVEGTNLSVTRYVTTMPDDLVYFLNSGSASVDNTYGEGGGIDSCYSYNQTVFDHYKNAGHALLNDGIPDKKVAKGGNEAGFYSDSVWSDEGDAAFPYNTLLWNKEGTIEMGYMLTNLTAGANYRIYIGTLSHWHARTVTITFNGEVVGADNLRINASKGFTVYENVPADANGKIDLNMKGGSTNEPCINFVAVQSIETVIDAVPAKPEGLPTIGLEDTTYTVTGGITEGAKIQMYNAARPNQLIFEEAVDPEKLGTNGSYVLDWGDLDLGVQQFNVVQVNNGGASETLLVSVTDIEDFKLSISPEGYTTGTVAVTVQAQASSGIKSWSYRLGEYGAESTFELDRPFKINESFTVTENGEYIVVVTSGMGVTYSEAISVTNIDPDRPVITFTPSKDGWQKGAYNVTLGVSSIAPVSEYTLYKNGVQLVTAEKAPTTVTFTEEGEYLVFVKTAAGRSATGTVCVSAKPTTTTVKKSYVNRTLKYTFADTDDFKVASVSVYELKANGVSRMTIASGNVMDVYNAGKYVVTVTTQNGTVEMFSLEVSANDFKASSSGLSGGTALGVGLGVGLGGVAIAAAAVTVTILLLKKKK